MLDVATTRTVPACNAATGIPEGTKEVPYAVALDDAVFEAVSKALIAADRGDLVRDYGRQIRTHEVCFVRQRDHR